MSKPLGTIPYSSILSIRYMEREKRRRIGVLEIAQNNPDVVDDVLDDVQEELKQTREEYRRGFDPERTVVKRKGRSISKFVRGIATAAGLGASLLLSGSERKKVQINKSDISRNSGQKGVDLSTKKVNTNERTSIKSRKEEGVSDDILANNKLINDLYTDIIQSLNEEKLTDLKIKFENLLLLMNKPNSLQTKLWSTKFYSSAVTFFKKGKLDDALIILDYSVKFGLNIKETHNLKARIFEKQLNSADAIKELDLAIKADLLDPQLGVTTFDNRKLRVKLLFEKYFKFKNTKIDLNFEYDFNTNQIKTNFNDWMHVYALTLIEDCKLLLSTDDGSVNDTERATLKNQLLNTYLKEFQYKEALEVLNSIHELHKDKKDAIVAEIQEKIKKLNMYIELSKINFRRKYITNIELLGQDAFPEKLTFKPTKTTLIVVESLQAGALYDKDGKIISISGKKVVIPTGTGGIFYPTKLGLYKITKREGPGFRHKIINNNNYEAPYFMRLEKYHFTSGSLIVDKKVNINLSTHTALRPSSKFWGTSVSRGSVYIMDTDGKLIQEHTVLQDQVLVVRNDVPKVLTLNDAIKQLEAEDGENSLSEDYRKIEEDLLKPFKIE